MTSPDIHFRIIKYGTDKSARIGIGRLRDGKTALGAVVKAIKTIEKDPRFNTWRGSVIGEDGKTVQMDAACIFDFIFRP